jgi:hypothetical protein
MRSVYFVMSVSVGIAGAIFLSDARALAETIYHWKDRNGVSCFSNTNIPEGAAELSVMFEGRPGAEKPLSHDPKGAAEERFGSSGPVSAEKAGDPAFDSKVALLMDRIGQRRSSIRSIENLLRIHPDDTDLRQRLDRKKQYLHEDLIHLGLLEK